MKTLTKKEVIDILEYNMAMLTCDMSISRDPEHQDVAPDYYGKDAEDLYYACKYCLDMLKTSIPIEWILKWANKNCMYCYDYDYPTEKTDRWFDINNMVKDWQEENERV